MQKLKKFLQNAEIASVFLFSPQVLRKPLQHLQCLPPKLKNALNESWYHTDTEEIYLFLTGSNHYFQMDSSLPSKLSFSVAYPS